MNKKIRVGLEQLADELTELAAFARQLARLAKRKKKAR